MAIKPLNPHYAMENPASVYDEEALTALQLAGRTTGKVNEVVEAQNVLTDSVNTKLNEQDNELARQVNQVIPATVTADVQKHIKNGDFDRAIDAYAGNLSARVNNLLGSVSPGSTTMDAEVVDIRTDAFNHTHASAGTAMREQILNLYAIDERQDNMLKNHLYVKGNRQVIDLTNRTESNYIIDSSGYMVVPVTGGYSVTEPLSVTPLQPYLISGCAYIGTYCYAFYDENGGFISGYRATAESANKDDYTILTQQLVFAPSRAATLRICTADWLKEMECFALTVSGLTAHSADSSLASTIELVLNNLLDKAPVEKTNISYVGVPDMILANTGPTWYSASGGNYFVSEKTPIEPLSIYQLTNIGGNFAEFSNCSYLIYDITGNIIEAEPGTTGGAMVTRDFRIVTPANARYIQIAYYATSNPTIEKVTRIATGANSWNHLKWCAIGDSLTEANHRTSMCYHDYIRNKTGIQVVNMGVSGTGYKAGSNNAFYNRIGAVPADADVVTIFGSGNDLSQPLGSPTDTGTSTICGCINTTIDNLYSSHPGVVLGIVAPTPWTNNTPADSGAMARYCEALEAICEYRGIPYLDLFHNSGLRPNDPAFRELAYSNDGNGVHPNEYGHKMIAGHVYNFLQSLIGGF